MPNRQSTKPQLVIAIDGPSGAGKSTVARALAARLGFAYLDTGAMYRAVTWYLLARRVDLDDPSQVAVEVERLPMELLPGGRVRIADQDVTAHLRSREVESLVSRVAAMPVVRARMTALQRSQASRGPVVVEGRDMTTVVFPDARWRFFLDANPEQRAHRRTLELRGKGVQISEPQVLEEISVRDRLDSSRADAPLRRSEGAEYVDTTDLGVAQVVERLAGVIEAGLGANETPGT